MNARTTALSALIAIRRQNAWADGALKEYIARDRLSRRDAALAARLVYGVVQNRLLLDFDLAQVVSSPLAKLQPVVLDILRLGAYQILFLDKIPVSAAVNEAVVFAGEDHRETVRVFGNGTVRPEWVLGYDLSDPEQQAAARASGKLIDQCPQLVLGALEILDDILE